MTTAAGKRRSLPRRRGPWPAAAILLALVFSASIYYTMWAVGIALFALAVYYTTKLM